MQACMVFSPETWATVAQHALAIGILAVPLALFWLLLESIGR